MTVLDPVILDNSTERAGATLWKAVDDSPLSPAFDDMTELP